MNDAQREQRTKEMHEAIARAEERARRTRRSRNQPSSEVGTPLWLRAANAEGIAADLLLRLDEARAEIESLRRELADAQTAERRACTELCREELRRYSAEGEQEAAFGALACVAVLEGRR